MILPKQLQNKKFRFIKITPGSKRPLEPQWQKTNNYKFIEEEFKEYLKTTEAFGVACGFGQLAIIDCDEKKTGLEIKNKLPLTFTVKTGGGGYHLYFIINNLKKKIIMKDDKKVHYGEVQFNGAQCLGPGSKHPSGTFYKIIEDEKIAKIKYETLMDAIHPYLPAPKSKGEANSGLNWDITNAARDIKNMFPQGNELVGPHPVHSSEGGENFHIDLDKNSWHCFRHGTGGDAFSLIGVLEGIIDCTDCINGYFAKNKKIFKEIMKVAEDKYKYENPLKKKEKKSEKIPIARPLTDVEIAELQKPELLFNIIKEIHKTGVVGEELSQLCLINKIMLRCVKNATKTSSNLLVSDLTGLGKDHLTKNICELLLVKHNTLFSASHITEKVLNYWEPDGEGSSWDGRLLYLQDPTEDALKCQAFKVRASGENEQVNLDKDRNVIYQQIIGKPVIIVTSMKATIDIELLRRWDSVRLDDSIELTKAIQKYQLQEMAGKIKVTPNDVLISALKNLPRKNVIIPYIEDLFELLPHTDTMRTQTLKVGDFVKASAILHQFQRNSDQDKNIIATWDDFYYARFVIDHMNIMENQPLTRSQERLMDYLKEKGEPIKFADIVDDLEGISESWLYRQEEILTERRLLKMEKLLDPVAGRKVKHFLAIPRHLKDVTFPVKKEGYISKHLEDDLNYERRKFGLKEVKL